MATINDIAKIAGVSTSTVSHVVNRTRYVSPELVERVEKAIQELDELPNFIVKKTKINRKTVGREFILLLLSEPESLFQSEIQKNAEKLLAEGEIFPHCSRV